MLKYGMSAIVAAAALALSGAAFGADAAGQQPFDPEGAGVVSTTTRGAVEAEAVKTPPAVGQTNEQALVAPSAPAETRADVKAEVREAAAQKSGFPDASGQQPFAQKAIR